MRKPRPQVDDLVTYGCYRVGTILDIERSGRVPMFQGEALRATRFAPVLIIQPHHRTVYPGTNQQALLALRIEDVELF